MADPLAAEDEERAALFASMRAESIELGQEAEKLLDEALAKIVEARDLLLYARGAAAPFRKILRVERSLLLVRQELGGQIAGGLNLIRSIGLSLDL